MMIAKYLFSSTRLVKRIIKYTYHSCNSLRINFSSILMEEVMDNEMQTEDRAESVADMLAEALVADSVPDEEKCALMVMLHNLLTKAFCDGGYDIAMSSMVNAVNIMPESPNLNILAHFGCHLLMKNTWHSPGMYSQLALSLMKVDQRYIDEDLRRRTLLAIWNDQELLNLPLEVLELMTLKWKLGLEIQCLLLCQNREHISQNLTKLCASSPKIFQTCISILTQLLIQYKGHQQVCRAIRYLVTSVRLICPIFWNLFPVGFQRLALLLEVDPEMYPTELASGLSRETVLDLLANLFCSTENNNKVSGLVMISCFPKWLPYLVEFHKQTYKNSLFQIACFVN